MQKAKREWVREAMLTRLRRNREGRLTPQQWMMITVEPISTLLLLLAPAILIVGLRLPVLLTRAWLIVPILLLILLGVLLLRARRYARAPLYARVMHPASQPLIRRLFSTAIVMMDEQGSEYRFNRWLAPPVIPQADRAYLVYYLEDGAQHVICSMIGQDDPEYGLYQPTSAVRRRLEHAAPDAV